MLMRQVVVILISFTMLFSFIGCTPAETPTTSTSSASEYTHTTQTDTELVESTTSVSTTAPSEQVQTSSQPQTTYPIIIQTTTTPNTTTGNILTLPPNTTIPPITTTLPNTTNANTTTKPVTTKPTTNPPAPNGDEIPPPDENLLGLSDAEIFAFFDDAVFVGDSVSLGWRNFVTKTRETNKGFMGSAKFLVSGSLGSGNALWPVNKDSVHPVYQGEQMQLWKSIPLTGAKKLFIMLGLNDVGLYGIPNSTANYKQLINNIRGAVPDISVYVISATYMLKGSEKGKLTSENLRLLNKEMIKVCRDNGYIFINIADPLSTPEGNLKPEYCSDQYVHQTNAAYQVWTKLLKGFAASQIKK